MNTPYTPGPWKTEYRKGADAMYRTEIFSEQHGGIATCAWTPKHCGNGVIETYREANARLIAVAPDLLDVVKGFRRKLETYVSVYPGDKELRRLLSNCDAAIAKVTGETA